MRVPNYGSAKRVVDIPATANWTRIMIGGIGVTDHQATIVFPSIAGANRWLLADKISFAEQ